MDKFTTHVHSIVHERHRALASIAEVIDSSLTVCFLTLTRLIWPSVSEKPPNDDALLLGETSVF